MPKSAKKIPRRPCFKRRAAAEHHAEIVINRILQRMPASGVKRIRGPPEAQLELQHSVEKKMAKTRATVKFLKENKQLISTIAQEHFQESKFFIYINLCINVFRQVLISIFRKYFGTFNASIERISTISSRKTESSSTTVVWQ